MSKQLVTIDTNVEVDLNWTEFEAKPVDREALLPLLRELEFSGMLKEQLQSEHHAAPVEVVETNRAPTIEEYFAFELAGDRISVWDGTGSVCKPACHRRRILTLEPSHP